MSKFSSSSNFFNLVQITSPSSIIIIRFQSSKRLSLSQQNFGRYKVKMATYVQGVNDINCFRIFFVGAGNGWFIKKLKVNFEIAGSEAGNDN